MRIAHVITGLETGGAENSLFRLLRDSIGGGHEFVVFSMNGTGTLGPKIERIGIPVVDLEMSGVGAFLPGLRTLVSHCAEFEPHVVQGWMYHANLAVTGSIWRLRCRPATIWGIRGSLHDPAIFRPRTRAFIRLGAWLSRRPDAIVFNSETGARMHAESGFCIEHSLTIPNGFCPAAYAGSAEDRDEVRRELGIGPDDPVIGTVGRYHHAKGSDLLLPLADRVARSVPGLHVLCVGRGMEASNLQLQVAYSGPRVHLLGDRDDVPRLLAAMDVFVNPSRTEGFPNVIAEAMLSRLPCVATDVGDTRSIVGDTGSVVMAGDLNGLADAVVRVLQYSCAERAAVGSAARERIVERYSQADCTSKYEALYARLGAHRARMH